MDALLLEAVEAAAEMRKACMSAADAAAKLSDLFAKLGQT
jgi:hypothetical protein